MTAYASPEEKSLAAQQKADDLKTVMRTPAGRRFIRTLLEEAHVFHSSYNPMSKNLSMEMAFVEGQKDVGYRLIARISKECPELYEKMMRRE